MPGSLLAKILLITAVFIIAAALVLLVIWRHRVYERSRRSDMTEDASVLGTRAGKSSHALAYPNSQYHLVACFPDGRSRRVQIAINMLLGAGVIIGRDDERSSITVDAPSISRRHARLFWKDGDLWIEDLNSTFGTFVRDGTPLTPQRPRPA